ncbi:MAG: hypothetical protein WBP94_09710 [Rhodomicrobiaceae bacterium]
MKAAFWLVIVLAVIVAGFAGYFAAKYGTADPCRALARTVQKDCPRFFSAQSCDDLKTMNEDRLTRIIRQQKGYFRCLLDLSANKPAAQ